MIKLIDLLKENSTSKYEFGCVMLYFDFPELQEIQNKINPEDVYTEDGDKTFGLEDEEHCTILYGIHEGVKLERIKEVINDFLFKNKNYLAHNVSIFQNEKYDVLKFDVEGDILHEVNYELKQFPHTNNFPKYHPHLTIGYLKPGTGKKYVKQFKGLEYNLEPTYVIYSQPNGTKSKIKID